MFLSLCDPLHGCGKTFPSDLGKCPHCGNPEEFTSPAQVDIRDWGYDCETFPNTFTCTWIHAATGLEIVHEISDRRDDGAALIEFMHNLGRSGARGVGFNNVGFDYPVLHWIACNQGCSVAEIYAQAMRIIKSENKFAHTVYDSDMIFQQIDLFKIWHFDNKAKSTSLKALEIAMRSRNVVDLPFPVGTHLGDEQKDVLIAYNKHDVRETLKFYARSQSHIKFREELTTRYSRNFMNHNDTKIGKDYFVMELEKAGVECFERGQNGRTPRQTVRDSINLADIIFPYVAFERPEFNGVLDFFRRTTITQTKGVFDDLVVTVEGVEYKFGTGGVHAAMNNTIWKPSDDWILESRDVTSYYPSMAIKNRVYPEHLSEIFCDIYERMFVERRKAKREGNDSVQAMLKLALNGTYGDSNNMYSPFYDPKFTMTITVNGQLMLCMLIEQLLNVPGMKIPNSNTDGVVIYYPRKYAETVEQICQWWQSLTMLELETETMTSLYQRDCNNYIAVIQ